MQILLLSDIHANFPALQAVWNYFKSHTFDYIINCGDSLVYAPFPNETLAWLKANKAISILGNTDKKVIKLIKGQDFTKPGSYDKKIMYAWTADHLNKAGRDHILSLKKKDSLTINVKSSKWRVGIYHGSPARHHEFLFDTTPDSRFLELSAMTSSEVVLCGHSHMPFYKTFNKTHFINPGSTGRMFDGDPRASCAIVHLFKKKISVEHFRIDYNIEETTTALRHFLLPDIYAEMYRLGRKTN